MTSPNIILNHLSFQYPNSEKLLDEISFTFQNEKYGIVADNGIGKTTVLKIIGGLLKPTKGNIICNGEILLLPQSHAEIAENSTLAEVLGVADIFEALKRIQQGSLDEYDFTMLENRWDIQHDIKAIFSDLNLSISDLEFKFHHLSGGQKTKVLLAKALLSRADFLLLDEPTNNLDRTSRDFLYDFVCHSKQAMIIVSHDRKLLNQLSNIIEISKNTFSLYGGNYDFFQKQKTLENQAALRDYQAAQESAQKAKKIIQIRKERHQQNQAKGNKEKHRQIKGLGSYDKIALKSAKGRSEKTNRRITLQADRKMQMIEKKLIDTKTKLEYKETIHGELPENHINHKKILIAINKLSFSYSCEQKLLFDNFNLQIFGNDRIAISGDNGSGKSTLVKLIKQQLLPNAGSIEIACETIAYLDQNVEFLKPHLTLVENYLSLNPKANEFDAHTALAKFNFRNTNAEKKVSQLSGGERIRAGLAITLMAQNAPELIILDEPTNHLDIASITAIESMLKIYSGAILAISHDETFLSNIGIEELKFIVNPAAI